MVNGNCSVVDCKNSRYCLKMWGKKICEEHYGQMKKDCLCPPPFRLHIFPSIKLNSDKRKEWIRLINRTTKRKTAWTPGPSDMVCSNHFIDGEPTLQNPQQTLDPGYEKPTKKARRTLFRNHEQPPEPESDPASENDENGTVTVSSDHDYHSSGKDPCLACLDKNSVLHSLVNKVSAFNIENKQLQEKYANINEEFKSLQLKKKSRKPFSVAAILSDRKMRSYTGIQTIFIFNALYLLLKPYVSRLQYWRGHKSVLTSKVKKGFLPRERGQKLSAKDQLLLVLMRLRLWLLNQDLADRFNISEATIANKSDDTLCILEEISS